MEEKFKDTFKQAAAFQKMWMDSMTGMSRVWSEYSPQKPPPEEIKKVRNGVLRVISQTWEEYMRSPEFLESMRDTMNNSVQWQKWANENTNKVHKAMGSSTKDDIQGVMVAVQHVERRILDCLDEMQSKVATMQTDLEGIQSKGTQQMEKYQEQLLSRLAEIEKSMSNGLRQSQTASKPAAAPKPAVAPKAPARKAPAKKPAVKKAEVKKVPVKKAAAKKAVAKKRAVKKPAVKKAPAKKVSVKKAAVKKAAVKKAAVKKAAVKKAAVKKVPAKKAAAKKVAKKVPAKKVAPKVAKKKTTKAKK